MCKILTQFNVIILCVIFLLTGCQPQKETKYDLMEIAKSDHQWTGIAVSKEGRIFVNYPRWAPNIPYSAAELVNGKEAKPYPNENWNKWTGSEKPQETFICVQSVYIDQNNFLWILDPANALFRGVVPGGAKLVKIDLQTDKIIQTVLFDSTLAPLRSYLNDVRIDVNTNTAYITDSGMGALITVDLNTGKSRRLLDSHYSTKAEDKILKINGRDLIIKVHSDGIALDTENGYLYYMALTGENLYRIKTEYLTDASLTSSLLEKKVELAGKTGPSDGLLFKDGFVYLSSIEKNSIKRISSDGILGTVAKDSLLEWPDSFSNPPGSDEIYFTTSRIGFPPGSGPFRIFKLIPSSK